VDATCPDILAPSHLPSATREARGVAALPEQRKQEKYTALNLCHNFTLVAIEMAGPFGPETFSFLRELGCRLKPSQSPTFSNACLSQCNGECHCTEPLISILDCLSFLGRAVSASPLCVVVGSSATSPDSTRSEGLFPPQYHPQTTTSETEGSDPHRKTGRSCLPGPMCKLPSFVCM